MYVLAFGGYPKQFILLKIILTLQQGWKEHAKSICNALGIQVEAHTCLLYLATQQILIYIVVYRLPLKPYPTCSSATACYTHFGNMCIYWFAINKFRLFQRQARASKFIPHVKVHIVCRFSAIARGAFSVRWSPAHFWVKFEVNATAVAKLRFENSRWMREARVAKMWSWRVSRYR